MAITLEFLEWSGTKNGEPQSAILWDEFSKSTLTLDLCSLLNVMWSADMEPWVCHHFPNLNDPNDDLNSLEYNP